MEVQEIEDPRRRWRRSLQLGVSFIILGSVAFTAVNVSALSVALLGWLILLSGVIEAVHAFRVPRSDGFLFHIVPSIVAVPIGLLTATHPAAGTLTWMLLFASFFTVIGLFRTISAFWLKFPNWGWTAFEGIVTVVLGTVMWAAWVWLVPWFFGFAVGISLLLRGWALIMFALGLRRLGRSGGSRKRESQSKPRQRRYAPS
ncbi:MAG TPA: HdeD family acid-resistance protein [Chthoniobacterales bacterium]